MRSALTIVMYHYVREIQHSAYPRIKGLELRDFRGQLGYIKRHYTPISLSECIDAIHTSKPLPPNPILLTFDDGYLDHFTNVFPLLLDLKIPGTFFAPGRAISERHLLDVNKIHFLLASIDRPEILLTETHSFLDEHRREFDLPENEALHQELAIASRFDSADAIFIKRLLQRHLSLGLRQKLTDRLFKKYVSTDPLAFANELYMTMDQIQLMREHGMEFGSHAWDHPWLNSLSSEEQETELDRSIEFLKGIGAPTDRWAMCYPYGAYNQTTLQLLAKKNCAVGFTSEVNIAQLQSPNSLVLPRLDTNDLPKNSEAEPNDWTRRILSANP